MQSLPALDFLEVHSENFFGEGGAALAVLQQARGHYPVSLHGVGLALGSAAGIDAAHLEQLAQLMERIEPVRAAARKAGMVAHAHRLDALHQLRKLMERIEPVRVSDHACF
eukprot:gene45493-55679_t